MSSSPLTPPPVAESIEHPLHPSKPSVTLPPFPSLRNGFSDFSRVLQRPPPPEQPDIAAGNQHKTIENVHALLPRLVSPREPMPARTELNEDGTKSKKQTAGQKRKRIPKQQSSTKQNKPKNANSQPTVTRRVTRQTSKSKTKSSRNSTTSQPTDHSDRDDDDDFM